jgi:hypothetical protein
MTSVSRATRLLARTIALAGVGSAALGCAGETSPANNLTTLYIYADYALPNVSVSVNGKTLGTITQQYTGSLDCTVLSAKGLVDGVLAVTVSGGLHYDLSWIFSSGKVDSDSFDATEDFFSVPCLLEPITAPPASAIVSGGRVASRGISGANR